MSSDDEIDESHEMNHCVVPDFKMDDDYPHIPSGIFTTSKIKSAIADEEIMELIWQNGQVIVQSQNQRSMRKSDLSSEQSAGEEMVAASAPMYLQEDEMASLLQSPFDDSSFERDLYADFLYSTPTSTSAVPPEEIYTSTAEIHPPPPPPPPPPLLQQSIGMITSSSPQPILPQLRCTEGELTHRLQNFEHFSRLPDEAILQNRTSSSGYSVKESMVVVSNDTVIAALPEYIVSRVSNNVTPVFTVNGRGREMMAAEASTSGGREVTTACESTLTPSTSGSGASVSASPEPPSPSQKAAHMAAEDRKRKGTELDHNEGQSEDVEFESADAKKRPSSSTFAKRSRAAEVHNLSERRRRDRINEKMRALQELIPHCNKSDKASMLDEAIEYLKSLQVQVQMMSTGCSMVPMMYPGIPQYMPTMGMTMGMGMRMEMGMNRPMGPYTPLMLGPAMRNAAAAAQMAPRYPLPTYHFPPFPAPGPSRIPAANQPDHPRLNSLVGHNTNQPRLPNFSDPYHQYFGLQQAKLMLTQNQDGTAQQQ